MSIAEMKILGATLYEAQSQNKRPELYVYHCKLDGHCPLLEKGECIGVSFLGMCMYSKRTFQDGPTKRASAYRDFVRDAKKKCEEHGSLPKPPSSPRLTLIGDYWWIPYAHADMCKEVPFERHSAFIVSGIPFVHFDKFKPHHLIALAKFRPMAMMGGEIKQYQEKSVPMMLLHASRFYPGLYGAAVDLEPAIAAKTLRPTASQINKATLAHIPPGRTTGYLVAGKHIVDSWSGEWLSLILEKSPLWEAPSQSTSILNIRPKADEVKVTIQDEELAALVAAEHPEAIGA